MSWSYQPLLPAPPLLNAPPSVTLNTPSNGGSTSDTTPTFDFTGTDGDGNDIRYRFQLDTVNTFDSGADETLDSYSESNADAYGGAYAGSAEGTEIGQTFQASGHKLLTSVKFYLQKIGSPTGNATALLYRINGTLTTGIPEGIPLATSDNLDVSTIPSSATLVEMTFSTPYNLVDGVKYAIVFKFTGGDISNHPRIHADTSSPSHAGALIDSPSGVWGNLGSAGDLCFYLYNSNVPQLNKISGTDSGFANPDVGGDTDPFTSGDNIQFTVQAGDTLSAGTYYWRVKGLDPTGSNTWGAWSSTFTLTITGATTTSTSTSTTSTSSSTSTSTTSTSTSLTTSTSTTSTSTSTSLTTSTSTSTTSTSTSTSITTSSSTSTTTTSTSTSVTTSTSTTTTISGNVIWFGINF